MKKTLFLLIAFVASMSINAQNAKVMKVLDGETVLKTVKVKPTVKVVFEDEGTTGTATRTDGVEVKWIQLWENGPKFAEYNVGAENNKAEDYGGYYCWGSSYKNGEGIDWDDEHNEGEETLSGDNDTATKLWGSNWRMPTQEELEALIYNDNCVITWTDDYKGDGTNIKGRIFTGKGAFASNSVFLPAAGDCLNGSVYDQGREGRYWSSTPNDNKAHHLNFESDEQIVGSNYRSDGYSVRAVLKE